MFLREDQLGEVIAVLGAMDDAVISEMRETGLYFWDQYFSSLENIVQTALLVLNDRVFPKAARSYERWNVPARRVRDDLEMMVLFITQLNHAVLL